MIRTERGDVLRLLVRSDGRDDLRARPFGDLHGAASDAPGAAGHPHGEPLYRSVREQAALRSDRRPASAGAPVEGNQHGSASGWDRVDQYVRLYGGDLAIK